MSRGARGLRSYHSGRVAEEAVARHYEAIGHPVAHSRWRGKAGEIDLIVRDVDGGLIFVEVKASATMELAAARLLRRQMDRLCTAASEYVAREPSGQLTPMRFDLATVDRMGAVHILENAFGAG